MIKLSGITKDFDQLRILKGLELEINEGEIVALIGPSGSGKSTLLRIIIGLISPEQGQIKLFGERLSQQNKLQLRHQIGYVIQEGGLFPHMSCFQNISLLAKHLNWDEDRIESRVKELCELTNIEYSMLDRLPSKLSGGQRQRVSLMRALMLDPKLILLDEPLASIDPLVRFELQRDLKEIFNRLNKTVVLVTHDLGEAAYIGSRIVLMKDGEIIQDDAPKAMLNNPATPFVEEFINAHRSPLSDI